MRCSRKKWGISFEEVVLNIQLDYVENKEEIFLKTIIPSRKATKHYVGNSNE
jgi:hypothetical protein